MPEEIEEFTQARRNGNRNLRNAKEKKYDEFYTRFEDIQKEVNSYIEFNPDTFRDKTILLPCDDPEWSNFTKLFAQNFENFGIKKLISTSYAIESKKNNYHLDYQLSLFETESPNFDENKAQTHGKIFTLTREENQSKKINIDNLEWDYLEGDGDFRSDEVKALRDEADIIVTNPPFSLFREFVLWLSEANKDFLILGNPNLISKREIFPLIANNKMWLGCKSMSSDSYFNITEEHKNKLLKDNKEGSGYKTIDGIVFGRTQAVWYTNLDHGRRHKPLSLMSMRDNIKHSKYETIRNNGYIKLDNYDVINVPFVNAIPNDYKGVMAVPISFLDKHCPNQFKIIGRTGDIEWASKQCTFFTPPPIDVQKNYKKSNKTWRVQNAYIVIEGKTKTFYDRIFIQYTDSWIETHLKNFE